MDFLAIAGFAVVVGLGSYVQAATGFALGLIVIGATTALGLTSIAFTASALNLIALFNTLWVLRTEHGDVHWKTLGFMALGILPGVALGLWLLHHLTVATPQTLKTLLGLVILLAGVVLSFRPHPWERLSGSVWTALAGLTGGVLGGLFSTPGPPIVFYLYRQPLAVTVIRSTLLAIFTVSASTRLSYNLLHGEITRDILLVTALSIPLAMLGTHFGAGLPKRLPPLLLRRFAFGLLVLLGVSLLIPAR